MNSLSVDPLPVRKGLGRKNLDLFLSGTNSDPVFFYFEDEGSEELYARLLSRIFPKLQDPQVVCMGGKKTKQYLAEADKNKIAPIVIVQDKDFDDINGELPADPRVVVLGRYSFENYLIDPSAIVQLAVESKRRMRVQAAAKLLDIDNYFRELHGSYQPLAALFVLSQRFNLKRIRTTKQPISEIVTAGAFLVSEDDLLQFKAGVVNRAIAEQKIENAQGMEDMLRTVLTPKAAYGAHADKHPNAHFCGKHLLTLALRYIDAKLETDLEGREQFEIAMRLVQHVSLSIFDRVRVAITHSLGAQGAPEKVLNLFSSVRGR